MTPRRPPAPGPAPRAARRSAPRRPSRTAKDMERQAAGLPAPPARPDAPGAEVLAMLVRRGLTPTPSRPDLPFPADLDGEVAERLAGRLCHYAFRLFLRGAILRGGGFRPEEATGYVSHDEAVRMCEELVELGLAGTSADGAYRLVHRAQNFGGTLEWWVARELRRRLGFDVATGLRSGVRGVGGDLDVVGAAEGKLLYLELKSSPPKHITRSEVGAFVQRLRALRPDVAVFAVDTALRLSDKVLPLFSEALAGPERARPPAEPRRLAREIWCLGPPLYALNAKQDLLENLRLAIADGLRALAPEPP